MSSRRPRDSYRPRSPSPPMRHFTGGDSYRPDNGRRSEADFSFRVSGAPRFPPEPPTGPAADRRKPQQRRGGFRGRGGFHKPHISERDILRTNRQTTPEQLDGMNSNNTARFMALDDVSDSEAEMELESSDEEGLVEGRSSKKARTTAASDGDAVPKWSNPDPYTVLPPPDESQAKKKDVVKLIRKAKVAALDEAAARNAVAENADFISFNFDDEPIHHDASEASEDDERPTNGTAEQSKFSHLDNLHPQRFERPDTIDISSLDTATTALQNSITVKLPPVAPLDVWPPPDVNSAVGMTMPPRDDNNTAAAPQNSKKRKRGPQLPTGGVMADWLPRSMETATPWCSVDHSKTESMGIWLHKEICDFYEFVKPHDFEERMRQDLITRISRSLDKNPTYRGGQVRCFGSFAAGLYLPTSDMDLVLVSHEFRNRGVPMFGLTKSWMYRFAGMLEREGLAQPRTTEVIPSAKVPIVKFIDRVTGLKVDISFENLSGVSAIDTFRKWKTEFPAMPVIVAFIKQFLLMRGLNEVYLGGIGGFSVICLVVSLMQHLPAVQSGAMVGEQNLGELLLNFFDLYGNKFNITTTGISMEPPGYYAKSAGIPNKTDRIQIIDPNNPTNDISNGSRLIDMVLRCFSEAYASITKRMYQLETMDISSRKGNSILGSVFAGDYSSFQEQRNRLRRIYAERR
ncbi:hypothetical protein W97_03890 [Coniosporium apollinis CBS 100218]|uniref:polynucleotide adenylyltransferase n=1 Tax=Coniosporium apollinis (strain CBS 100218) TaxID=1168221 RepID=R7YRW6_CONA1|nr:uncharacterized protein W97_03890 [Coniosporium apollinis CBS 100218]EON64657.1 hypothetical protein W97_03890 [Coniosporium apollinis CBS 100218]